MSVLAPRSAPGTAVGKTATTVVRDGSALIDVFLVYVLVAVRATLAVLLEGLGLVRSPVAAASTEGKEGPAAAPGPLAKARSPKVAPAAAAVGGDGGGGGGGGGSAIACGAGTGLRRRQKKTEGEPSNKDGRMSQSLTSQLDDVGVLAAPQRARIVPTFMESVTTAEMPDLAAQVRRISQEAFEEDAMRPRRGEKVAAMLLGDEVVGYASYAIRPDQASLNVNKIAISLAHRRRGLGRNFVKYLIQLAKRPVQKVGPKKGGRAQPLEVVCLSSLPTAVGFYAACGFREDRNVRFVGEDADSLIEGQVYMEYRLRRRHLR
mmetsp:Transcript_147223/g.367138  ORF Transcript_147223/g.367138 Transcript_147223/m.367138 type:complete len:319 (+) Transcript_147223:103-1059(+)